jgi:hypothetical protein
MQKVEGSIPSSRSRGRPGQAGLLRASTCSAEIAYVRSAGFEGLGVVEVPPAVTLLTFKVGKPPACRRA